MEGNERKVSCFGIKKARVRTLTLPHVSCDLGHIFELFQVLVSQSIRQGHQPTSGVWREDSVHSVNPWAPLSEHNLTAFPSSLSMSRPNGERSPFKSECSRHALLCENLPPKRSNIKR